MSDVQRWAADDMLHYDDGGLWVTYADHVEALRQAEQRAYSEGVARGQRDLARGDKAAYEQGQRDALAAAVQRAIAEGHAADCLSPWGIYDGCTCVAGRVLTAIKGDGA